VVDDANKYGWLALGVPGTVAGLQMVLERFGTRSFAEAVAPAIEIARGGFTIDAKTALALQGALTRLRAVPGSAKLYLRDGEPFAAGATMRNPDLARLLSSLAKCNSAKTFYEGDIAAAIVEAVEKNGGLLTEMDFASYKARAVRPLRLSLNDFVIHTAPLTAGGLTSLEALQVVSDLKGLAEGNSLAAVHARVEALRLAWKDRLTLLGDPERVSVPVEKLLYKAYAQELAGQVQTAVKAGKPLAVNITPEHQGGTVSLSAADRQGNLIALTLTHGGDFGAQVTVEGLGLTLGHGMSRFDPRPGQPNSPGPGKRPLHNMCPTIVFRGDKPVLAVGGAGGVRIPNALFCFLEQYVLREQSLEQAIAAPRFHTTGTLETIVEPHWPAGSASDLRRIGFDVKEGVSARLSAVELDGGICKAAFR
jgi:gamma-glutamyltranspeptidase/glutathione hydrolase